MCGFGGIIGPSSISRKKLHSIAKSVSHRGPDFTGIRLYNRNYAPEINAGNVGIFHNRLSIIDLDSRSNQPFEDEQHILIFNGEIYNFQVLKNQLISLGYAFRTTSDTEVLFYALKAFGKLIIPSLNGMFAFGFIDKKNNTLLLARDRMGIKPIYFSFNKKSFVFASEIDSIIRLKGETPSIDQEAASLYELFQYIPDPKTIWEDIESIPPSNLIHIRFDKHYEVLDIKKEKYWDSYSKKEDFSSDVNLYTLLNLSLEKQLIADVPVGVSLSSGADSSLLSAMINKNFKEINPIYFSIALKGNYHEDESNDAKKFLEMIGVDTKSFRALYIDNKKILQDWIDLYKFIDQPFGDPAILLNQAVAKSASNEVSVLISGDGADEIFYGYPRYKDWSSNFFSNSLLSSLAYKLGKSLNHRGLLIKGELNPLTKYLLMIDSSRRKPNEIEELIISCDFYKGIPHDIVLKDDFPRLIDINTYLPAMLYKVDRSSMASGIEARVPYLDNLIIEYGLSQKYFEGNKPLKWEIKSLLTTLVPKANFSRPKKGFSFPLLNWMALYWSEEILDLIHNADLCNFNKDKKQMLRLLKNFQDGNRVSGHQLWIQLNLLRWFEAKKPQLH